MKFQGLQTKDDVLMRVFYQCKPLFSKSSNIFFLHMQFLCDTFIYAHAVLFHHNNSSIWIGLVLVCAVSDKTSFLEIRTNTLLLFYRTLFFALN
jgi:hypothetical protein